VPFTLCLLTIVLGYTWVVDALVDVRGLWRQLPTVLVLGVVIAHNMRTGEWGFSRTAFLPALKWTALVTPPIALALWVIGHAMGPSPQRREPWLDFLYLIVWGGGQQLALQTVVLREAQRAAGRGGVALAAGIFAALHLPNPFLTLVTAIGGLAWCWIYTRAPNIIPLAISHAASTLVILLSFDPAITGGLRTGWAFLEASK
jgi:membrane protease YdiL (CAAX protease family)